MKNTWAIAERELRAYFSSPIAYIVIAVFLMGSGYFFYILITYYSFLSMQYMRYQAYLPQFTIHDFITRQLMGLETFLLILLVPVVTMRLLAEEKKLGTYELLLTSPVRTGEIVAGKYLGSLILYGVILTLTLEFPLTLAIVGTPDLGPTATSYLGLFFIGAAFLSIGLFFSSITESQVIAAVLSFGILFFFFFLVKLTSPSTSQTLKDTLSYLSLSAEHFENFTKGMIDSRDIVFYLSFIIFMLFLTFRVLESERWRE